MSTDEEDQNDEILALREICGDDFQTISTEEIDTAAKSYFKSSQQELHPIALGGRIYVSLDLSDSEIKVEYQLSDDSRRRTFDFAVKHLLPYQLTFLLPSNYPSQNRPLLSIECPWLTRKQKRILLEELNSIWEPGIVFLFTAVNFLKEQSLQVLGIDSTLNVTPILRDMAKRSAPAPTCNSESEASTNKDVSTEPTEQTSDIKECQSQSAAAKGDTRYGFVQRFINDRSFGFIRCVGEGRAPASEIDYNTVKNLKQGDTETNKWLDVYFRKKSVVITDKTKPDFFRRRGTLVKFSLATTADNRNEARAVQLISSEEIQQDQQSTNTTPPVHTTSESDGVEPAGPSKGDASAQQPATAQPSSKSNAKQATACDYSSVPSLVKDMQDHHDLKEEEIFFNQLFDCMVCFATKPGAKSIRFPGCCHVYCKTCMKSYFEVQIGQGMMNNLTCPEEGCKSQALPTQIKDIVAKSAYDMYETQLLQTTLESMADVDFCPRLNCQCATIVDREMNMGQCPKCHYAFCVLCKQAYHGQAPCSINSKEKIDLLEEYLNGDADRKAELEKRYGQKHLKHLSENYLSDVYMRDKAKKCPKCQTPIEKSDGCNKMTCHRCNTYFCYLCEAYLPRHNPYAHFSDRTTMCFNQLFQGLDNMDEIIDEQWNLEDGDDWEEDEDGWEVPFFV